MNPTIPNDPKWIARDVNKLSAARREALQEFLSELKRKGASPDTITSYIKGIRSLGFNGKPYEELNEEDLIAWMEATGSNGWSNGTINLARVQVKHFLRWNHGCKSVRDPTPEFLKCIVKMARKRGLPRDILSRAEVKQLVDACKDQRDRCLVFLGYETGTRAGELLNLKIGDVEFDEYGAVVRVNGKTGERRLRIVESVPDLRLWLSMLPCKENPKATLWPQRKRAKGEPLKLSGLTQLLENLRRETGINKHVHPHLLRHTRATHLASVLTEAQMREFFGWTKSSRMPEIYVHLSGRDVDSTLLKHYGIKVEVPKEDLLGPKACPWCQTVNSASARFCQQCNAPLDPASASKAMENQRKRMEFVDDFLKWLQQRNPDIADDFFKEKRKELEGLAAE